MSGQRLLAKVFGPCIVLLLLAGVFDLACTLYAHRGGWLQEMNPLANYVLDAWGEVGLITFKAATTLVHIGAMCLAVRLGQRKQPMVILLGLAVVSAAYALLVTHWLRCLSVALA